LWKIKELGHYFSAEELEEETPEVVQQPQQIAMHGGGAGNTSKPNAIPREYRKIKTHNLKESIAGEYVGAIVMYDYSGKHIVKTTKLKIRFDNTQNGKIYGQWVESDTLFTDFEAVMTDSTLQFLNTEYRHTERYSRNLQKKWRFNNAVLEKTETDSLSYLVGNIQQYDAKLKEPSKPLYISVQKNKRSNNAAEQEKDFLTVYPNPFEDKINILFSVQSEQNVTLSVYDMNGTLYDHQNLGTLPAGKHNYLLALTAPKGEYLIVLQKGDKKISNIIIKK
jgi:hypothetical protein